MTVGQLSSAGRGTRRARNEPDKLERRGQLLEAARALFSEHPYEAVTVREIATRAGLAKGTFYLYFQTKEQLFLNLLTDQLHDWLGQIDPAIGPNMRCRELAKLLSQSVSARPHLVRLIGLMHGVLEHNLPLEAATSFKVTLVSLSTRLASVLDRARPGLGPQRALGVVRRMFALVIGLGQMSEPSRVVMRVLEGRPELSGLRVDLEAELREGFEALIQHAE